jgi:glycine cleavage system H protein
MKKYFLELYLPKIEIKSDLKYTKDHEWIKIEGNNATIGVTDYAQGELGDIVYVEIEALGDELNKEEIFGSVEAVKTVSDLFLPISGKITEMNENLEDNPELINDDPYGKGWIIKMEIKDVSEIEELLTAESYKGLIGG